MGIGHGLNILAQLVEIGSDRVIVNVECPLDILLYTFFDII